MKKVISLFVLVLAVSVFAIYKDNQVYSPSSDGTIHLRMSQVSSENGAIGQAMERFAQLIHERTEGRYTVDTFHNGQLGGERDNIENCQMGVLDISVVNQAVLANFIPEIAVLDIPYIITGAEHADKVFLGEVGDYFLQRLDGVGLKGLTIWESGFRNLTNSRRPIEKLDDVKELRVRTMENRIHQQFWRNLGSDPVPMAWSEAYTAMQQGAIDGQENPTLVILTNNVGQVNKQLAVTEHAYSTVFIIMSPTLWKRLSDEDREIFANTIEEVGLYEREINRSMEKEALEKLKAQGVNVTYPDKNEFITASEGFRESFNDLHGEMLTKIQQAR